MSFLGFLTYWWVALLLFILAVVSLIASIIFWLQGPEYDSRSRSDQKLSKHPAAKWAAVALGLMVVFGAGLFFSMGHTVIPVNKKAIVKNTATGTLVGSDRSSGLTRIPMFTSQVRIFPGAVNEEVCTDFTPSALGGYEVKITSCFYIDASKVNWTNQYNRYAKDQFSDLLTTWANQLSPEIAIAIKDFEPAQLTNDRDKVSAAIKSKVEPFFKTEGIPLGTVSLKNWDFTNKAVRDAYDQAAVANTLKEKARAEYAAAQVERETALYRADTQLKVLDTLTTKQIETMQALGISDSAGRLGWLQLQWLKDVNNVQPVVVVGNGSNLSIPMKP